MKKLNLICASAMAAFALTAVQTTAADQGTNGTSVAMAAQKNFSKQNYAVMAYLKYTKQDINSVKDNSVDIENEHGHFEIDNENDKDFVVEVNGDSVTLKSTDQHGKKKSHTYAKKSLTKQFANQQAKLNSIVEKDD